MYEIEIPVGNFTRYKVYPTCGIATRTALIGEVDEPRYFDAPEVKDAGILWFTKGFVEYRIPNYLKKNQMIQELQISFEISSEAPGSARTGRATSIFRLTISSLVLDESRRLRRRRSRNLYAGLVGRALELIRIAQAPLDKSGRHVHRRRQNIRYQYRYARHRFRQSDRPPISVPDDAKNIGGATLFGKGFGNYNQDIRVRTVFSES
jgi:predicted transcriptional regulator